MPENLRNPFASRALRFAIGVGAAYALFGIAWILVSDQLVVSISSDPRWLGEAQRTKGLAYILVTAVALVLLVRWGTLRMLAANALVQSRELQVQDLFMRHPQPMWVYDQGTLAFRKVNEAALRCYGYTEAEFLGMTLKDIRPQEDLLRLEAMLTPSKPAYRDWPVVRHRRRSGEIVPVHILSYSVPYEGRPAVMVMATDITEQVEAQQALERQEAQFRQLHQSLGEVLWLAGIDGQPLIYVSPAFETVYGRPVADFRANLALWLDCVVPEDRARAAASSLELAARGRSSCEYRIRRPDGSLRWLSDRKRSITDENGKVVMIGGIAEDITATKERDAARATTQAQLEAMVAERTAALERVNAELDSFARTAAHDMKSPLNAIAGFSQIVQHKYGAQLGAEGRRMVALIEQSALDMATLINDLLSLSRMTAAELRLADADLAELGREIIDTFRQHEPHRVVSFDAPPNLAVRCDAGLARSLMTNLLGNAWKFTNRREQAAIRLTVSDTCRGAVFSIEDNGAGFDPAQADRLFKPFQRLHSVADFSGTGLGLVTCQRIVQRHGGAIWAQARPGQGATFHFTMAAPPAASHGVEAVPMAGTAAREPDVGTRDGELLIAPAAD